MVVAVLAPLSLIQTHLAPKLVSQALLTLWEQQGTSDLRLHPGLNWCVVEALPCRNSRASHSGFAGSFDSRIQVFSKKIQQQQQLNSRLKP